MERFNVGDTVGLYVNGVQVDRGQVFSVLLEQGAQIATIGWDRGGPRSLAQAEDVRRVPRADALLDPLRDLPEGLSETDIRGGAEYKYRRTDHPWMLSEAVKAALRPVLEARGFDVSRGVRAQEFNDREGIYLSQYDTD